MLCTLQCFISFTGDLESWHKDYDHKACVMLPVSRDNSYSKICLWLVFPPQTPCVSTNTSREHQSMCCVVLWRNTCQSISQENISKLCWFPMFLVTFKESWWNTSHLQDKPKDFLSMGEKQDVK
jgi:hypothetical protein